MNYSNDTTMERKNIRLFTDNVIDLEPFLIAKIMLEDTGTRDWSVLNKLYTDKGYTLIQRTGANNGD